MILAAGRGERLRPLTDTMPKPMIPISSEPLIVHQLRWLRRAGIKEVVVNLHHLGEQIEAYVGSGRDLGVTVQYSHERELLDTGGGIANARSLLGDAPFLILNGDIWTNYSFRQLLEVAPASAHVVLTPKPPHREAADFHMDGDHVRRGAANDLVYCGISVLSWQLFDAAPQAPFSLRDLLFRAVAAGTLHGELFDGTWIDIGSHDQLKAVRRMVA